MPRFTNIKSGPVNGVRSTPFNNYTCSWDSNPVSTGDQPTVSVNLNTNATTDSWVFKRNSTVETNWDAGFSGGVPITNAERHDSSDDENAAFGELYYYGPISNNTVTSQWYYWATPFYNWDCDYEWDQSITAYSDYHGYYVNANVYRGTSGIHQTPWACGSTR